MVNNPLITTGDKLKATGNKMSLPLQKNFKVEITIDNFYRGRFEINGNLYEFSETGKAYYYIEFYEEYCMELFTRSVKAMLYEA